MKNTMKFALAACLALAAGPIFAQTVRSVSVGSAANYTTGTVATTSGSPVVTGTGTAWITTNRGPGDSIAIGATGYMIDSVTSETRIVLRSLAGSTQSGAAYTIMRKFSGLSAWGAQSRDLITDNQAEVAMLYKDAELMVAGITGWSTDQTHTITIKAAPGNRHIGKANTGVVINGNAASWNITIPNIKLEGLEIRNLSSNGLNLSASNCKISGCLIRDGNTDAKAVYLNGASNDTVFNCIIYGHKYGVGGTGSGNFTFINNTVALCDTGWGILSGIITRVNNNIFWGNKLKDVADDGTTAIDNDDMYNICGDNSLSAVPGNLCVDFSQIGFIDTATATRDLHILGFSAAKDQGVSFAGLFNWDIDDSLRPQGPAWDIGADEYYAFQYLALTNHVAGQKPNAFGANGAETGAGLFAFLLYPGTGTPSVTQLVVNLSNVSGIATGDMTGAALFIDANSNGIIDAGEATTVGGSGSVNITGTTGTVTFSSSFNVSAPTNYILRANVANLVANDSLMIGLLTSDITTTYAKMGVVQPAKHKELNPAGVEWDGGGADGFWNTGANWSTDVMPSSGDSVIFKAGTKACSLSNNVTVKSITFTPGYTGTFYFKGFNLALNGGADFRSGGALNMVGTDSVKFQAGAGMKKLIPPAGPLLPAIYIPATCSVRVMYNGFKTNKLTVMGYLDLGVNTRDSVGQMIGLSSGFINFGTLCTLQTAATANGFTSLIGMNINTGFLEFTGTAAQNFTPKMNVKHPSIIINKSSNSVTVQSNALKAGILIIKSGVINLGTTSADTVDAIMSMGAMGTLDFNSTTLNVTGNADLSGLSAVNAGTGTLKFIGSALQSFTPKAGATHPNITLQKDSIASVTLSTNDLIAGLITINSGVLGLGAGRTHQVMSIMGNSGATVDFGSSTLQSTGTTDFNNINVIAGTGTLEFSGSGAQTFTPRANMLFPNITKSNTGSVICNTRGFKAKDLTITSGSFETGAYSDTVANLSGAGSLTITTAGGALTITGSSADFSNLSSINASGSLRFMGASAQTFTPKAGYVIPKLIQAGAGGTTVQTNGLTADSLIINTGTFNLGVGLTDSVGMGLALTGGGLNFGSATLKTAAMDVDFSALPSLIAGTGTLELTASGAQSFIPKAATTHPAIVHSGAGGLTLSTNDLTANSFINSAGMLNFAGLDITTVASGDFTITNGTASTISGLDGITITVAGNASLSGQNSNLLNINPTSTWYINATGTLTADYATIGHSDASGSASRGTVTNSTNSGNNINWGTVTDVTSPLGSITNYPSPNEIHGTYQGSPSDIEVTIYDGSFYWSGSDFSVPTENWLSLGSYGSFSAGTWTMTTSMPAWESGTNYTIKSRGIENGFIEDTVNIDYFDYTGPTASHSTPTGAISMYPNPNKLTGAYTGFPTDIKVSIYCMDSTNYWNGTSFSGPETYFSLTTYGSFSANSWEMTTGLPTWSNCQYNIGVVAVDQAFGDTNWAGSFTYTGPSATLSTPSGAISMYPNPNKLTGAYTGFPTDIKVSIYCMDSTNYWNGTSFSGPETYFSLTTYGSFSANSWEMTTGLPTWSNCQYNIGVVAVDQAFGDTNWAGSFTYTGPSATLSTPSGAISMYPNPNKLTGSYSGFPTDIKVSIYCMDSTNYWNGTSFSGPETYFSLTTYGSFSANSWEMTTGLPTWSNCQYNIKVVAVDNEFGDTNTTGSFTYTGPTAIVTGPTGNVSSVSQLQGTYTGTPTNIEFRIYNGAMYWDGGSWTAGSAWLTLNPTYGTFSSNTWQAASSLPTWTNGAYTIDCRAIDNDYTETAGAGENFTLDNTAPTSSVTTPANAGWIQSVPAIDGSASDAESGLQLVEIRIMRSDSKYWSGSIWDTPETWFPATGTTSWSFNASGVGFVTGYTYTIVSRAKDNASNTETPGSGNTFTFDDVAPTSSISVPVTANSYNAMTSISGSANDPHSGVTEVQVSIKRTSDNYYWDGTSTWVVSQTWLTVTGTNSWSYDASGVTWTSGNYTVISRAQDNASNTETPGAGITFTFDNTAPTSSVTSPAGSSFQNAVATISGTASDANTVSQVDITIQRIGDSQYWTGAGWGSQTWLTATGTTTWSYDASGVSWTADNYTVISRAQDDAANQETPGAGITFTFDNTAPTSSVTSPAGSSFQNAVATISGTASDANTVSQVDITIQRVGDSQYWTGAGWGSQTWLTATGTTTWSYDASGVSWTSDNYTVISRAQDDATNQETPGAGNTFTFDNTGPTVDIQNEPAYKNNLTAFNVTFEFSEDVTGFAIGDITAGNASTSNFSVVDGNTYTCDITPTGAGNITIDVAGAVCVDAASNGNSAAAQAVTIYDAIGPTVDIQNEPGYKNNLTAFNVTFEFSEDVTGFAIGDITAGNASTSNFSVVDGNTYTCDITPTGAGNITIDVAGAVCVDTASNGNSAAAQAIIIYDAAAPTVMITTGASSPTSVSPFGVTITFNEDVSSFVVGNISVGNGTAGNFSNTTPNRVWTADVTPTSDGLVTIDVNASVTIDLAGNTNTAATQVSVTYDNTKPTVSSAAITSPNGGEVWQTNISNNITWNTGVISDAQLKANPIALEFSNDGGSSWNTIASNEANDGVCSWTPTLNHPAVWVRIVVTDSAGNVAYDTCNATFIVDNAAPSVPSNALTAPNNGEVWQAGTSHSITWSNGSISDFALKANPITLEYTIDGSTWNNIASNEANDGSYLWTVASVNSATVKVRIAVTDSIGLTSYDTSDAYFFIDNAAPVVGSGAITAPNGSETWGGGTSHNITWTTGSISDVKLKAAPISLKYSTDGGASFPNAIVSNMTNSGSYNWTVPSIDNNQVRVQIAVADSVGNVSYDTSNTNFTIDFSAPQVGDTAVTSPNGGEKWVAGSTHPITWNIGAFSDALLKAAPISLQYSTDNGATFPNSIVSGISNSGLYNWTLPSITLNTVRVRFVVTDSAGNSSYDTSNAAFKIDGTAPTLAITSPTDNSVWNGLPPISGTASDSGTGLAQVQVNITRESDTLSWNDSSWSAGVNWVTASGLGSWVVGQPSIWTTGYYIVKARASDSSGNMYTIPTGFRMLADSTKPVSAIIAPASGVLLSVLDTIKGTASDAHSGVQSTKIRLFNKIDSTFWTGASWSATEQWITAFGTTAWAYAYLPVWTSSVYEITARAWDSAGNAEAIGAGMQFRMDVSAPTVMITSGVSGTTNVSPIPVTITFSESVLGMNLSKVLAGNGTAGNLVNTNATTWTADITPTADGSVTVNVAGGAVTDSASNGNPAASQFSVNYDGSAPTGASIIITDNQGFTNDSTPTLMLAATGADSMRFNLNNGAWSAWEFMNASNANFNVSAGGEGLKRVYAQYKDAVGNITASVYDSTILDVTAPAPGTLAITGNAGYTNNAAPVITLSAGSADSMRFQVNGSAWSAWETYAAVKSTLSISAGGDGQKIVIAAFKDLAGNVSSGIADTAIYDATAPSGLSVVIQDNAGVTKDTLAALKLIATGADSMRFQVNAGAWSAWLRSDTIASGIRLGATAGAKIVTAQFRDLAGNSATAADTTLLDLTAPTSGSITIASNGGFTNDSTPALILAATDADSMRFKVDTLTATAYEAFGTSKSNLNISANGQGLRTVAVMYKDRAGNATAWIPATVTLDVTPPSGVSLSVTSQRLTSSPLVNLSLTATSADSMRFKVNTGAWGVWEMAASAKSGLNAGVADGVKRIYATFKDKAGNMSAQVSDTMTLDATPPINSAVLDASVTPQAMVRLYWGGVALNPADVESVAVWYRTDRYPTVANDTGAILVSRGTTVKTADTLQNPALGQKYFFGLFLRDAAGNWSALGAAARDTAMVSYPVITIAGDTNAYEDSLYTLDVNATVAGNGSVTFALLSAPAGMTIVSITGIVSWTPSTAQIGDTVVSITASDGVLSDTLTYALHVHMVNKAPVFVTAAADIPDTVFEYQAWQYAVRATDADSAKGDSVWYFLPVHPVGMAIDAATGMLTWSVDSSMVGWSGSARVIVFDTRGGSDTLDFTIAAGNVNDAPVILTTAAIDTVLEDSPYSRSLAAYDKDANDALRWRKVLGPAGMTVDSLSGNLFWTPGNSDVGSRVVSIRVVDAGGLADTLQFMVRVLNTNDAPVIATAVVRDSVFEDMQYQRQLAASDMDMGDSLTLRWRKITMPQGMTIDSVSGMVRWVPANSQVGDTLVRVMVRDFAGASDTLAYQVLVVNTNDAPVIVSTVADTVIAFEDTLYRITVAATDQDVGDSLRYAKIQGPAGAVMAGNRLSWTPLNSDVGSYAISIRVSDRAGAADTLSFVLLVRNINDTPVFTLIEEPYVYYGALKVKFRVNDADRVNGFDDTLLYRFGVCKVRTRTDSIVFDGTALLKDSILVGEIYPLYDDTLILFGEANDRVAAGVFKDTIIIGAHGQSVVKQTFTAGSWHMMSIPTTDLAQAVGTSDSAKRIYRWDPRGNVYTEPSDTSAWDLPGTGFWMLTDNPVPMNVASAKRLPGGIACSIRVIEGWNQISSPYPYAVMFSPEYADTLWTWNNGQYVSNNVLEPWKSYFYHAPGTGYIVFDGQPYNPDKEQVAARALAKPLYVDGADWRIRVSATGSFSADRNNYAGVHSAAKTAVDPLDQFEPPASPLGGVSVWFESVGDSTNRLSRDLKSAQSGTNWWVMAVDPAGDKGPTTLSFEGLPEGMYVYIGDKGQFVDLTKKAEVTVKAEARKYYSLVVTDDQDFLANLVTQYDLTQNWPNPFNPTTNLSFSVPVNFSVQGRPVFDKQRVTLKIFDLGGRLVRTVTDDAYQPGRKYIKTWNGKANNGRLVASGMYVYQVEIGSAAGGFVKSRKMVVVK